MRPFSTVSLAFSATNFISDLKSELQQKNELIEKLQKENAELIRKCAKYKRILVELQK